MNCDASAVSDTTDVGRHADNQIYVDKRLLTQNMTKGHGRSW